MREFRRWGIYVTLDRQLPSAPLWVGPAGLHLFWPLWRSRLDWCANWREPIS